MQSLFHSLKIIDLSTVLAGPSVATFFAELGATVIKVENPKTNGDVTRGWKLAVEAKDTVSAYFSSVNFGKEYVWLDLNDAKDLSTIQQLIAGADVVISNFKQGDDQKFGLTPEAIFKLNAKIIDARITGFGSQQERVAYDVVLQAECGFMHMNGTPDSGPVKMPVAMIDVLAAHQLKEGILCALYNRNSSGKGSLVTCSLEESGYSSLVNQATNYLMAGAIPQRLGSLHPNIAPYGETFVCKDEKPIILAIGSEKQFENLCGIINRTDLLEDQRFADNQQRVRNRALLAQELAPAFMLQTRDYWIEASTKTFVPMGAIKNMAEVFEVPLAQRMIRKEKIQDQETMRVTSVAFHLKPFSD